jgi:hypothetical protein
LFPATSAQPITQKWTAGTAEKETVRHYLEQKLPLWQLVDGIDCQHCVTPDIGVPVLKVAEDGRNQGLQDLLLTDATQEAQSHTTDELVGMLQVVPEVLADLQTRGGSKGISSACQAAPPHAC